MKLYTFGEGDLTANSNFSFERSFFNLPGQLQLQAFDSWLSLYVLNEKYKTLSAVVHFHLDGSIARSPVRSPFGSFEFDNDIPPEVLYNFLIYVEERLLLHKAKKIVIKNPPASVHAGNASLLQTFLFNLGYSVINAEVGAVIPITSSPFLSMIDSYEKRRLRQAQAEELVFQQVALSELSNTYNFIYSCRTKKGYPLSMTLPELEKAVEIFPDRYLLFAVQRQHELAGACIAIKVRNDLLYNFYADHNEKYDRLSPVVMIIDGLYKFCQQNNIAVLDLGTSAVDQKPNFGLLDFKLRLGGIPSPKLTFQKKIG